MKVEFLNIKVYAYPSGRFLGSREAPYYVHEAGESLKSNADEINSQVKEVRLLNKKKEDEVYFKTSVI